MLFSLENELDSCWSFRWVPLGWFEPVRHSGPLRDLWLGPAWKHGGYRVRRLPYPIPRPAGPLVTRLQRHVPGDRVDGGVRGLTQRPAGLLIKTIAAAEPPRIIKTTRQYRWHHRRSHIHLSSRKAPLVTYEAFCEDIISNRIGQGHLPLGAHSMRGTK